MLEGVYTKVPSLEEKLRGISTKSRVSLMPDEDKPKKEPEVIPDLREVVSNPTVRLRILRLTQAIHLWGVQERDARVEKKIVVDELKNLLTQYEIHAPKFMADDLRVLYYEVPRSSISMEKLLEHKISPKVIAECTVITRSMNLKISMPGEKEDESNF